MRKEFFSIAIVTMQVPGRVEGMSMEMEMASIGLQYLLNRVNEMRVGKSDMRELTFMTLHAADGELRC